MAEIPYDCTKVRLARMMRSSYSAGGVSNYATHQLWNNSSGAHVLVVRMLTTIYNGTDWVISQITQTKYGTVNGNVHHVIGDHAPGPGLHYFQDSASALPTPDYRFPTYLAATAWPVPIPVAVLPPGWGLAVQGATAGNGLQCGFYWEYLDPADVFFSDLLDLP